MKRERKKSRKTLFESKMREYRRVLKKDFDYDWEYILILLKYKLSRTRECIVSNNVVMSASKIGREIRQVEDLLDRVVTDLYFDEISKDHKKKYGSLRMLFGKPEPGKNTAPITFKFSKENPRNRDKAHREHSRLQRRAEFMRRRDLKRAFDLMNKNIWGWWD